MCCSCGSCPNESYREQRDIGALFLKCLLVESVISVQGRRVKLLTLHFDGWLTALRHLIEGEQVQRVQRFFKWWEGFIRAWLHFQQHYQLLDKVDMESADYKPAGCWRPKKLGIANDFLVNHWRALLPGVSQPPPPPPPPPLLWRTGKWDGLHYVYCCSSWWAPICDTCLVIRAVLIIIICFVFQWSRRWGCDGAKM